MPSRVLIISPGGMQSYRNMQPLTLTLYDRNVRQLLTEGNQSSSYRTPDGETGSIFPTHFHYIFEDDEDEREELETDGSIENIIILHLEESGALVHAELISDNFELLSYNRTISAPGSDESPNQDFELEVVSQFGDLSPLVHDLPLADLIKLYTIQNEQLQIISYSM